MSYKFLEKIVYKISNNPSKLLKGITTNDLDKNTNAFLDRFGRLIAFCYQKQVDDEIYLTVEKDFEDNFLENLDSYNRFAKCKIERTELKVVHVLDEKTNLDGIKIKEKIGFYLLTKNSEQFKGISNEEYEILRIENNIPIQGVDFYNEMFLETNLIESISFTKGCYVGQEIITKVYNKAKPIQKLVRILFEKIPEKLTSNGKGIGKITSKCFSKKYNKYLVFAIIENGKEIDSGRIV